MLICETDSGEPLARVPSNSRAVSLAWHPQQALLALTSEGKGVAATNLRLLSFPDFESS